MNRTKDEGPPSPPPPRSRGRGPGGEGPRVGTFLPQGFGDGDAATVRLALRRIEAAGLDYVGAADHISFHTGWGQDALVECAMLAMLTELPVYTGVYLLPLRHPVPVARQIIQVALRAPGRLTLGIGVGGEDRREVEMCGVDPATRGRRTDECLQVIRGLLSGERLTFAGEFFRLDGVKMTPVPPMPVPIIVGGRDPRVLRRAGRYADGWLGIWSTPESYARRVAEVEQHAADAGRSGVGWDHGLQPWVGIGRTREAARSAVAAAMQNLYRIPFERFERFTPYGTPEEVAAALRPYVGAGCQHFNVSAQASAWEEAVEGLGEVRTLLRAPTETQRRS